MNNIIKDNLNQQSKIRKKLKYFFESYLFFKFFESEIAAMRDADQLIR